MASGTSSIFAELKVPRRVVLATLAMLGIPRRALAFGKEGAFHARPLLVGDASWEGERSTAPARWAWELIRRTSAPGQLVTHPVVAVGDKLLEEPFVVWAGSKAVKPLTAAEIDGLRRFFKLGGLLFVDDSEPATGAFGDSARREIARVLPNSPPVKLSPKHVIYKSYYLIERPIGRLEGPDHMEAILSGKRVQVLFSRHDVLGALARSGGAGWTLEVESGTLRQRELAIRMAINIALYVLCSDYKDDQVHAKALMRRRGRER